MQTELINMKYKTIPEGTSTINILYLAGQTLFKVTQAIYFKCLKLFIQCDKWIIKILFSTICIHPYIWPHQSISMFKIFSHRRIYLGQCQGGSEGYLENTGNIVGPHPEWDVTGHHAHTQTQSIAIYYSQYTFMYNKPPHRQ